MLSQRAAWEDEQARVAVVKSYAIHDACADDILNVYVRLAAAICDTPIGLVSIVESDEQCLRARYGLNVTRTSRDGSFCTQAIQNPGSLFIVPDALADPRFAESALVKGEPFIRFYAAVSLVTAEKVALGTLCVIAPEPRTLDESAQSALRVLGEAVMTVLEERRRKPWQHEATPFLFERNPNPMWIYDTQTLRFLAVNDAATRQYGYRNEEFLAMTLRDIRPNSSLTALTDRLDTIGHGLAHSKGWKHQKRDGSIIDVTITSEEVRFRDRPARLVLATDTTRETQAELELVRLAHHDALTGVLNRAGLDLAFEKTRAAARHSETGGAVLFLDLKNFKAINDRFGHAVGDSLLACVARRLAASAREVDVIARTGGEFLTAWLAGYLATRIDGDRELHSFHRVGQRKHVPKRSFQERRYIKVPVLLKGKPIKRAANVCALMNSPKCGCSVLERYAFTREQRCCCIICRMPDNYSEHTVRFGYTT